MAPPGILQVDLYYNKPLPTHQGQSGSIRLLGAKDVVCWSFGAFRLDASTSCLWRDEQLVPLAPRPLAVLAYLVAHAGEVVTKDELLEAVWPETVVSEGVLKTCIGQIRQVLGETGRTQQYIATIPPARLSLHCASDHSGAVCVRARGSGMRLAVVCRQTHADPAGRRGCCWTDSGDARASRAHRDP